MADIENNNGQLQDIKTQMKNLTTDCKNLHVSFEDKKLKVLELRASLGTGTGTDYTTSAWSNTTWNDTTETVNEWPVDDVTTTANTVEEVIPGVMKYRALYEFVARNQDEISFQPGDIILVTILKIHKYSKLIQRPENKIVFEIGTTCSECRTRMDGWRNQRSYWLVP